MENSRTRYILVIVLMTIFGIMQGKSGYSDYSGKSKKNPLRYFPLTVGEWTGKKEFIDKNVYRILETDTVLMNTYRKGREAVIMSTVYYSDEKVDFHSPEGCSVGKGDMIDEKNTKIVALDLDRKTIPFRVNKLIIKRADGTKDLIYYFFKTGNFVGPDYLRFRYNMGLNYIETRQTSGALIILTTPVVKNIPSTESTLKNLMESFHSTWLEYL